MKGDATGMFVGRRWKQSSSLNKRRGRVLRYGAQDRPVFAIITQRRVSETRNRSVAHQLQITYERIRVHTAFKIRDMRDVQRSMDPREKIRPSPPEGL